MRETEKEGICKREWGSERDSEKEEEENGRTGLGQKIIYGF